MSPFLLDWTVILTIFVQTTSGLLSLDYHLITIKCRSKIANLYCILLFCAPNSKTKQVGLVFHQNWMFLLTWICFIKLTNQNYKVKLQWTFCKYVFTVCKNCTAFSRLNFFDIWVQFPNKLKVKVQSLYLKHMVHLGHDDYNWQCSVQIGLILQIKLLILHRSWVSTLKYLILLCFTLGCGGSY